MGTNYANPRLLQREPLPYTTSNHARSNREECRFATLKNVASLDRTRHVLGANWIRPGSLKCWWRVVVGQLATLKAD